MRGYPTEKLSSKPLPSSVTWLMEQHLPDNWIPTESDVSDIELFLKQRQSVIYSPEIHKPITGYMYDFSVQQHFF